jgi:hypothetical protein
MDYLLIVEDTEGKVLLNQMQKRGETLAQLKDRCSERFGNIVSFAIGQQDADESLKEEEELDMADSPEHVLSDLEEEGYQDVFVHVTVTPRSKANAKGAKLAKLRAAVAAAQAALDAAEKEGGRRSRSTRKRGSRSTRGRSRRSRK